MMNLNTALFSMGIFCILSFYLSLHLVHGKHGRVRSQVPTHTNCTLHVYIFPSEYITTLELGPAAVKSKMVIFFMWS